MVKISDYPAIMFLGLSAEHAFWSINTSTYLKILEPLLLYMTENSK